MTTREIFKRNLNVYIKRSGKNTKMISQEMGIPYTTLIEWVNGNNFPRANGIEMLSRYFRIPKSYLLEEASENSQPSLSPHEEDVLTAYREQPDKQPIVDYVLGVTNVIPLAVAADGGGVEAGNSPADPDGSQKDGSRNSTDGF